MLNKSSLSFNYFGHARLKGLLLCILILVSLQACTYKFGILPDVSKLEKIQQGVSTKVDVLMLLGEPRGKGKTRFMATIPYPFDIWFYEYVQSDGKTIDVKYLLVFMDREVYQGYVWFSSKDLIERE